MLEVELDGLTGKATWTEDGECDKEPKAFVIENGEYKKWNNQWINIHWKFKGRGMVPVHKDCPPFLLCNNKISI